MRFFKGTAAERATSDKTAEAGDLVVESDTGNIAVADGSSTLGNLQRLARANEVSATQAAAATDATTKANAARAGAVTDVTTDITGGSGPVATALSASIEQNTPGTYGAAFITADSGEELPVISPVVYNPTSLVQNTCPTDQSWEDIDATNLVATFVCPPSGRVLIKLSCAVGMASGGQSMLWRLYDKIAGAAMTNTVHLVATSGSTSMNAGGQLRPILVTTDWNGVPLVPGKVYSWAWQQRQGTAATSCYTQYGGVQGTGPAVMEIIPLSNRVTTKTVTAAIESDPNWQPVAVDADSLHMIGFAGTGQPGINGRLAYSSDAGATWTALPNLVTPAGSAHAWYAGDGEILVAAGISGSSPGSIWKSTGWAANPATATFTKVLSANDVGGLHTVYFANYSGYHMHGGICVVNEYGPKTSSAMARYVYATEDHGATWRTIFDLHAFTLDLVPAWDGADAHVHASAYDPYWDAMWVVTGDYDGTQVAPYTLVSFDWRKPEPTWHIVYTKHQFTVVVPMKDCLLFGTDMGSSAADGYGNGFLRLNRSHPGALTAGREAVLEPAYIYDTGSGISVIALGYSRRKSLRDAPYLLNLGESGASGPTGRILATYDGLTFKELWTATNTGITGSTGQAVFVGNKITTTYQASGDSYRKELVTLTLS